MAAVVPATHEGLQKPKAFVVVRESQHIRLVSDENKEAFRQELQEYVKSRLSKHKYPRWVVFADDLPRNDRGKVDRRALSEGERRGTNPWK
jgi:acyl-coenzyme A synthetase/AMP-(fatty) acid ligase